MGVSAARAGMRRSVARILSSHTTKAWNTREEKAELESGRTKSTFFASMSSGLGAASKLDVEMLGEREGGSVRTPTTRCGSSPGS